MTSRGPEEDDVTPGDDDVPEYDDGFGRDEL